MSYVVHNSIIVNTSWQLFHEVLHHKLSFGTRGNSGVPLVVKYLVLEHSTVSKQCSNVYLWTTTHSGITNEYVWPTK